MNNEDFASNLVHLAKIRLADLKVEEEELKNDINYTGDYEYIDAARRYNQTIIWHYEHPLMV